MFVDVCISTILLFVFCLFQLSFFPVSPFLLPWSYLSHFNSISFCRVSSPFWFPAAPMCTQPWGPRLHTPGCPTFRTKVGGSLVPVLASQRLGDPAPSLKKNYRICWALRQHSSVVCFPPALGSGLETQKDTQHRGRTHTVSAVLWILAPFPRLPADADVQSLQVGSRHRAGLLE